MRQGSWIHGKVLSACAFAVMTVLAGCGGSDDNGTSAAPPPAATGPAVKTTIDASTCAALVGMALGSGTADTGTGTVQTAVWTPAATATNPAQSVPDHCLINGVLNARTNGLDGSEGLAATTGSATYGVRFQLRLPSTWNTKFLFSGIGGTAGAVSTATGDMLSAAPSDNALLRGYAVATSDTGHESLSGTNGSYRYGYDPQARLEYGYQFLPLVTNTVKQILNKAFNQGASKSYWTGTSGGGRQGMKAVQMYPAMFDAAMVSVPAFRVPGTSVADIDILQTEASISAVGVDGVTKDIATAFSTAELQYIANGILAQCDALDGVSDGMVSSQSRCHFNPQALLCPATGAAAGCLSQAKIDALSRIYAGIPQYAPFNYDPGLVGAGWRSQRLGTVNTVAGAPNNASISTLMPGFLLFDAITPPLADATTDLYRYSLTASPAAEFAKLSATSSKFPLNAFQLINAESPNLDAFKAHGGKLLIVQGLADPYFSPIDIQNYVNTVINRYGATEAGKVARLFLVPGMNHGQGGPTTDRADILSVLDNWSTSGTPPDSYVASVNPANADLPASWSKTRTRLICAYPTESFYKGGDPEAAASFECR